MKQGFMFILVNYNSFILFIFTRSLIYLILYLQLKYVKILFLISWYSLLYNIKYLAARLIYVVIGNSEEYVCTI